MKTGMEIFGTRGVNAVSNDLKQLKLRNTFEPLKPRNLIKEESDEILGSHLFLKENKETTVKVGMVFGGNKQSGIIDKEDAESPT